MAHNRQRVDKATFKQIFRDHWAAFQQRFPRYQQRDVQAVIDKRLGCGDPATGYFTYLCEHCLEEKRVAFSCKSSFCLSCCKVYIDQWVAHIGQTLYEGVAYRHVVLTVPKALQVFFYQDRPLLADLMLLAGGGAYLSIGTALAWPAVAPVQDWAFYPSTQAVRAKLENETGRWKWPVWWWIKRFNAWPASVEALSGMFDFNRAPSFQSFMEVRVEASERRVRLILHGVNGPLRWRDLQMGGALPPQGASPEEPAEWSVPMEK